MKDDKFSYVMQQLEVKKATLYRIAYNYTRNQHDAEDCIADAVLTAMRKFYQLKNPDSFYPWYVSILINTCRKFYRKHKNHLELDENTDHEEILTGFSAVEDKLLVEAILSSLKKDEADILVLKYMNEFTLREIAYIMGIPENTVKSKIHRSLKSLKKLYGGLQNEL